VVPRKDRGHGNDQIRTKEARGTKGGDAYIEKSFLPLVLNCKFRAKKEKDHLLNLRVTGLEGGGGILNEETGVPPHKMSKRRGQDAGKGKLGGW